MNKNQKINRATLVNACTAVGNTADPDNVDFLATPREESFKPR